MDDRTQSRPIDQLAGDGWLLSGPVRLGPVTYVIDVHVVSTSLGHHAINGMEFRVRLLNHSLDPAAHQSRLLTLELHDGRQIVGFMSDDGGALVRTGALA